MVWNIYSKNHTSIHIYMCTYCFLLWGPQNLSLFILDRDADLMSERSALILWTNIYLFMCIKDRDCKWNLMVRRVQLKQISFLFGTSVSVFPACWKSYLCFSEQIAEQWDFTPRCWKLHGFRLSHRHAIQTKNVLTITNCIRDFWKNCSISDG